MPLILHFVRGHVLGFEDVISEVLLVSDFQQSIAYIIFRRRGI